MKKMYSITYHLIGHLLPDSYFKLNIFGKSFHIKIGYYVRGYLASKMISSCGKNINIERGAKFNKTIKLGNNSGIGKNCGIGPQTIIGDNVMTAPEVIIYTKNHKIDRIDIPMCKQGFDEIKPVIIEDDVWLGRRVMIMPGVTIGKGSVIGAGAVVAKNIPPYSIAVGNPAKVIKSRLNNRNKDDE